MLTAVTPLRSSRARRCRSAAFAVLAILAATPAPAADKPNDPLERFNRATYAFNDALDRMLARPAAKAYKTVVPEPARQAVSNLLANLAYPTVIVNNALQGKLHDAGSDTLRFAANTVIGIGGLFDPATRFGLPVHDEDFGQTLGWWGVPPGPYFVLPVFGPSDFRDAPARLVDHYTDGDYWLRKTHSYALNSTKTEWALWAVRGIDRRAALLSADAALAASFDPYAVVRNAYVTRREYLVRDGNLPEETYDEEPEPGGKAAPAAQPEGQPVEPEPPPAEPEPPPPPRATRDP